MATATTFWGRKAAVEFIRSRGGPESVFTLRVMALLLDAPNGKWVAKAEKLPSSPASYVRAAKRLCEAGFAVQIRDGEKLTDEYRLKRNVGRISKIKRYYADQGEFLSIEELSKRHAAKAKGRKKFPPFVYLRAEVDGEEVVFTPVLPSETEPLRVPIAEAFRYVVRAKRDVSC